MIHLVEGSIATKKKDFLVIATYGVGYKIYTTNATLEAVNVGDTMRLWTYLAVRENALELFGFNTQDELEFFELLLSVSGIGPRTALGIIGLAPINKIVPAIASGNTAYLTTVSGIGKKNAEKIVLELSDKLSTLASQQEGMLHQDDSDTLEALAAMGYSLAEARGALRALPTEMTDPKQRLKAALRSLGK